jgi:RNA polymerase sigma-70 factor (family 1)
MKITAETEVELLERLKSGDSVAFLAVYNSYHAQLYRYVLRYVKVPELAEDVIHDVFLKLWEVRQQIKPELSVTGYLYRISRNHVFKLFKKITVDAALRKQIIAKIDEAACRNGDEYLQWREYSHLLQGAIEKLSPQQQKVFKLCRIDGKTYEETARILGISPYTVKEYMSLSLKCIKEYFHYNADISLSLLLLFTSLY